MKFGYSPYKGGLRFILRKCKVFKISWPLNRFLKNRLNNIANGVEKRGPIFGSKGKIKMIVSVLPLPY